MSPPVPVRQPLPLATGPADERSAAGPQNTCVAQGARALTAGRTVACPRRAQHPVPARPSCQPPIRHGWSARHERVGRRGCFQIVMPRAVPKSKMAVVAWKTLYMDLGGLAALGDRECHSPVQTC